MAGAGATMLQSTMAGGGGGTLAYLAPEAFDEEYIQPSEVYSFAIIVWELITCKVPWAGNAPNGKPWTQARLMRAVCNAERPKLPAEAATTVLGALAQRCWQGDTEKRPSFEQVRARGPFFRGPFFRGPFFRGPFFQDP